MFLTYQHAKIDRLGLFGGEPTAWSYVEHNIHRPWFYVATVTPGDDFALHPMLMMSNEQLLQSLLEDQEQGLRVESVLLVTPDHLNHSGGWLMEPLESIVRYESPEGMAYVYQVLGEKSYLYGDADVAVREGSRGKTLFSTSMLSSPLQ